MRAPVGTRNAMAQALVGPLDGGYVEFRTGSAPDPDDPPSGTLLATVPLADPAFSIAGPTATADVDPEPESTGVADGEPGWFRAYSAADATILDGEASEMTLNTPLIATGVAVRITAWIITMPDGS